MYSIQKRPGDQIKLGRKGEYNARRIALDLSAWQTRYGDNGTVQLLYQRPGDATPYPVPLTREDHLALWTVAAADTANSGNSGRAELRYYIGDALVKSAISQVVVEPSLGEPGDAPDEEQQSWLDQAVQAGSTAQNSAAAASNSAQIAQTAAETAAIHAQSAQHSAQTASASAQSIQTSAATASTSASAAESSAQSSAASAVTAQNAANQAASSTNAAEASAQGAAASAQSAQNSAQTAAASAQSIQTSAETASTSASAAEASAQSSAAHAQTAQSAADQATSSANAAEASAQSSAVSAVTAQNAADEVKATLDTLVDDTIVAPDTLWSSEKIIDNLCESALVSNYCFGSSSNGGRLSFNPVAGSPLSVGVDIDANPEFRSTPKPTSSNPLKGWSSVSLSHTTDTDAASASYNIDFGCTVYGGTLECITGLLTITHKIQYFDGSEDWQTVNDGSACHPVLSIDGISPNPDRKNRYDEKCSHYAFCTGEKLDGHTTGICSTSGGIEIYDPSYTQEDPTAWKECLAALNTEGDPLHVVVRLNEPCTVQLEPTQIIAFSGANTVRCSIGNFEVSFKQDFNYERQLRRDEMSQLKSDMSQLKNDVDQLKSDVAALQSGQ